jgi:hypothetical protein
MLNGGKSMSTLQYRLLPEEFPHFAVKFVSTTPCEHLYGVLCVTERPHSQDSFAALTIH